MCWLPQRGLRGLAYAGAGMRTGLGSLQVKLKPQGSSFVCGSQAIVFMSTGSSSVGMKPGKRDSGSCNTHTARQHQLNAGWAHLSEASVGPALGSARMRPERRDFRTSAAAACTANVGGNCPSNGGGLMLFRGSVGDPFCAISTMDLRATFCATFAGSRAVPPAACFSSNACNLPRVTQIRHVLRYGKS